VNRLLIVLCLLAGAPPALAQEHILAYDTEVSILPDGSLDVTEHIRVRAEGSQIRRGIYRDFPTRYRDRHGNRYVVDFEVLGVERDGQPEPWFTERISNGVRVNTGNDDFLRVPAEYTFTLRYRTSRQLGFFAEHDELYWNAIGAGWVFPILSGTTVVRLPRPVPQDSLGAEGYTGYQGTTEQNYTAEIPEPGVARYRLTQPLQPYQAFTVVLTFPKGVIAEPTQAQRAGWLLRDNLPVLLILLGVLTLLFYTIREWRRVGRDPRAGVIIARYQPPADYTPGALRFMRRMRYDMRCFTADVLGLAVAGHLNIGSEKKFLREQWWLERTEPEARNSARDDMTTSPGMPTQVTPALLPAHRTLLEKLFSGKSRLELKNTNTETVKQVQEARRLHQSALDRQLHGRHFQRNAKSVAIGVGIAVLFGLAAFFTAAANDGAGLPFVFIGVGIMVVTLITFSNLVQAPTAEGRELLDEIDGLRMYLSVAERDDIARVRGPDQTPLLDAERYEALLPYAMALEVEDAWTKKFTVAVGAAAAAEAARRMTWYHGAGPIRDIGGFTRAVGSSLNSQISSASSPPGSSSGSGGGGSSGGGGGGGGGGGR
jgi:uncharacterized membrane protein YgcG